MQVFIQICAIDEDRGVKATRETTVEVPGKVLKLYEILGGDEDDILRRVGDTVFAAAMRELQSGRVDIGKALTSAGGGRIGGRQPIAEQANAAPEAKGADALAGMLGLDIIRNQVQRERGGPRAPVQRAPAAPRQSPGVAGFPK
jgi:hypothetical protein